MNSSSPPETAKKRRSTSLPLILGVVILGCLAYYFDAGLHFMTYVMYLQEKAKVTSEIKEAKKQELVGLEDFKASQEAIFKSKDADGNGKLEGAEIGDLLAEKDKDGDGAVSREEFTAIPPAKQGGLGAPPDQEPPVEIEKN